MSARTPSRQAVLSLYHNMLRTSQSFSSYNFREYFVRRTKDTFRTMQVISPFFFFAFIYFPSLSFFFFFSFYVHQPSFSLLWNSFFFFSFSNHTSFTDFFFFLPPFNNQNESDPEKLRSMYSDALKESAVLTRSAVVNQLYGGWKLAVEAKQLEAQPEANNPK